MSREFSFEPVVCTEYEKLLEESSTALDIWNQRRAQVSESRLRGQNIGDQLLRLQANYAKAYTVLENHAHACPQCQLASRIGQLMSRIEEEDSQHNLHALSGATLYM